MRTSAEGGAAYLSQRSQAKSMTWLYPSGGTWLLSVNVYDTYGAVSVAENPDGPIFVQPALRVNNESLSPVVKMAESYIAVGDAAAVSQIIAAAAETINAGSGGVSAAAENVETQASHSGQA